MTLKKRNRAAAYIVNNDCSVPGKDQRERADKFCAVFFSAVMRSSSPFAI
jgi:hypothetical protein